LPGYDPHQTVFKACQDLCFFSTNGTSTILGLFDGNGKYGEEISQLCVNETDEYFNVHMVEYEKNPVEFLYAVLKLINDKITDCGIDILNSGCSCVIALINSDTLYIANIGNSHAIIGTYNQSLAKPSRGSVFSEDKQFLLEISKKRQSFLKKQPVCHKLTCDHTTDNQEEFIRVLKCGGRIQQKVDEFGNSHGPYYVWKNYSNIPGLKITRSIGNTIAQDIGIINTPHIAQHKLGIHDEFLILASEGIWSVMKSQDVANFVDNYKDFAQKTSVNYMNYAEINSSNSCIARLLCEEARIRWLAIVENDDTMIDDISCIILEFDKKTETKRSNSFRMSISKNKN
jgi:serine/threonine protein phosphatase PrpC